MLLQHKIKAVGLIAALFVVLILVLSYSAGRADDGGWMGSGHGVDMFTPPGSDSYDATTGTYTVTGGGVGFSGAGNAPDHYRFVYTTLPKATNFRLVMRIASLSSVSGAVPFAGVALRSTLDPIDSEAAAIYLQGASSKQGPNALTWYDFDQRTDPPAQYPFNLHILTGTRMNASEGPVSCWFELIRWGVEPGGDTSASSVALYKSPDGVTWTQIQNGSGGAFVAPGAAYVGFVVGSGTQKGVVTARIDRVTLDLSPTIPYESSWIGNSFGSSATGYVSGRVTSMWTASDGTCYTNSDYDEAGEPAKVYRDGRVVGALGGFCSEVGGGAYEGGITGDGTSVTPPTHLYLWSSGRVIRTDLAGHDPTPLEIDLLAQSKSCILSGLACAGGKIFAADAANGVIDVVDDATLKQVVSFPFAHPGPMVVDRRGNLWIIRESAPFPVCYSPICKPVAAGLICCSPEGAVIASAPPGLENPVAIAYDWARDRLLVGDNGPYCNNVRIYTNLDGKPRLSGTFGYPGGVFEPPPSAGLVYDPHHGGDARFFGISGVGIDGAGNIYVACGQSYQSDLRAFRPDGSLLWRLQGLEFTTCGDFDPSSPRPDIYTIDKHYAMDWSVHRPGGEWSLKAYTANPFSPWGGCPNVQLGSAIVRRVDGALMLINSGGQRLLGERTSGWITIYRFTGEQMKPCAAFRPAAGGGISVWDDANGNGLRDPGETSALTGPQTAAGVVPLTYDMDEHGNLIIGCGSEQGPCHAYILTLRCVGLRGGVPQYDVKHTHGWRLTPYPAAGPIPGAQWWTCAGLRYDAPSDTLYLMNAAHMGLPSGTVGATIACYPKWSTTDWSNPADKPAWVTELPTPDAAITPKPACDDFIWGGPPYPTGDGFQYGAFDAAGDKIFVAALWGAIHVLDASTGKLQGLIVPGPEVDGSDAWQDEVQGIRAHYDSADGEYDILEENSGFRQRENLYRWSPPGGAPLRAVGGAGSAAAPP